MHQFSFLIAALAVASCAATAQAQTTSAPLAGDSPGVERPVAGADLDLMEAAAEAGQAEMQAAELALTRATDPAVKEFAQTMMADYARSNARLRQLARAKGVSLPNNPSIMHRSKLELLKIAENASFERQYIDEFGIQAHRQAIDQFQQALQHGQDPQVNAFARQALPALEQRLQRAQSVLGQL